MGPSGELFLDRDEVYQSAGAQWRAKLLYDHVRNEVYLYSELCDPAGLGPPQAKPFRKRSRHYGDPIIPLGHWHVVAEVAENYPKLLAWLTEGQVHARGLRNVFGSWVAIMRLVPGLRWLLWKFIFKPVASHTPWRLALYDAIVQRERCERNRRKSRSFNARLRVPKAGTQGLSAVTDIAVITQTNARAQLRDKIINMASGCIGVSGLRGSGKTTLIQDFCAHRYGTPRFLPAAERQDGEPSRAVRGLRIVVDAPLRFEAREFLIYLYTCLCRAVLADVRFSKAWFSGRVLGPILLPRTIRPAALLGALVCAGFLALAGALAYHAYDGTWPMPRWHSTRAWETAASAACVVAAMAIVGWRTRRALIEVRQVTHLAADAEARLRRLHFQRKDSLTSGGQLKAPMGAQVSIGTAHEFTEQAMSLPELIDDYRDFAERVVAALIADDLKERGGRGAQRSGSPGDVRLIIGIDAMDQIQDPAAACKFLDELSSVFGTKGCVYLLSVEPATLAAVDQRAVPLKTSSGGYFDEMVWVDPLTRREAELLLDSRVSRMPQAFIALCYVLSGGLPRELLRVARAMYGTGKPGERMTLAAVTKPLIWGEIVALWHRALASAVSLDISVAPGLAAKLTSEDWLEHRPTPPGGVPWLQAILDEASQSWADAARRRPDVQTAVAMEVRDSFLAGLYFLLMTCELFRAKEVRTVIKEDLPVLRELARARIALGVSPQLAVDHVSGARRCLSEHAIGNPDLTACITFPCAPRWSPPDPVRYAGP